MNNKYFTPDIEDIRIGYECECLWCCQDPRPWWSIKVLKEDLKDTKSLPIEEVYWRIKNNEIRVPYLTKEQIEAEGWKFKGKSVDLWWEKEGSFDIGNWTSYKVVMHYGMKGHIGNQDLRLYIYAEDQGDEHRLFEGECKDINTFRQIQKLLNIK